jgi:alpha-beta hydrolase superfamily lysophospholipase
MSSQIVSLSGIKRELVLQPPPKPSRLIELMVQLGLASGVGALAAQYLIARWLTRGKRGPICETPSGLGLDWEPFVCRTEDGYRLHGWIVGPPRPRATLLLFHGIRNTREQTLSRLGFLVPAGYRCLAADHRAHGESSGRRSSFGYHERHDVQALLKEAKERWPEQPLGMLGISMGAAAVCYAAADVRAHAGAVILESLYHDVVTAFTNRLKAGHYPAYFEQLTWGVIRQCERRVRVSIENLVPANSIAGFAPVPLMILTGSADRHSTPEEAEKLFARRSSPGKLLLVPGAGHDNVCEAGGSFYRQHVLDFLEHNL